MSDYQLQTIVWLVIAWSCFRLVGDIVSMLRECFLYRNMREEGRVRLREAETQLAMVERHIEHCEKGQ